MVMAVYRSRTVPGSSSSNMVAEYIPIVIWWWKGCSKNVVVPVMMVGWSVLIVAAATATPRPSGQKHRHKFWVLLSASDVCL